MSLRLHVCGSDALAARLHAAPRLGEVLVAPSDYDTCTALVDARPELMSESQAAELARRRVAVLWVRPTPAPLPALRTWRAAVERHGLACRVAFPLRAVPGLADLRTWRSERAVLAVASAASGPAGAEDWHAAPIGLVHALDLLRHVLGPFTHVSGLGTTRGRAGSTIAAPTAMGLSLHTPDRAVASHTQVESVARRGDLTLWTATDVQRLDWLKGRDASGNEDGLWTSTWAGFAAWAADGRDPPPEAGLATPADAFSALALAWAAQGTLTSGQPTAVPTA